MYSKLCPDCKKKSYSSNVKEKWICPYCGNDLSNVNPSVDSAKVKKTTPSANRKNKP